MTHGDITIEIKSDALSEAISVRDFLVTCNQVLWLFGSSHPFQSPTWRSEPHMINGYGLSRAAL